MACRELFPLDSGLCQACFEFCVPVSARQLEILLGTFQIVIVIHRSILRDFLDSIIGGDESSCAVSNSHENEKRRPLKRSPLLTQSGHSPTFKLKEILVDRTRERGKDDHCWVDAKAAIIPYSHKNQQLRLSPLLDLERG